MPPKLSQFLLEVQLPLAVEQPVFFRTQDGESWTHVPAALDTALCTAALWDRLRQDWDHRREVLLAAGDQLGRWLFDERSTLFLASRLPTVETSQAPFAPRTTCSGGLCRLPLGNHGTRAYRASGRPSCFDLGAS